MTGITFTTDAQKTLTYLSASLDARKQNVENTINSQKRIIALNDSYSKRTAAYTKMVLLTVFVLTIAILLKILQTRIPFLLTDGIMTIVYIAALAVPLVYALFVISDINAREKTDFDKLDLAPPTALQTQSVADRQAADAAKQASGDLSGLLPGMCLGSDCCKDIEGVIWNPDKQQCILGENIPVV